MKTNIFLKKLEEEVSNIMDIEGIETWDDIDVMKGIMKKEFEAYRKAGGRRDLFRDFSALIERLRKKSKYRQTIKSGKDIAKLEKRAAEKRKIEKGMIPKKTILKTKVKEKTEEGLKQIVLGKITKEKGDLWKIDYEGQEFILAADAILHLLMKDQRGEVE